MISVTVPMVGEGEKLCSYNQFFACFLATQREKKRQKERKAPAWRVGGFKGGREEEKKSVVAF